jgi:GxxExxY protein
MDISNGSLCTQVNGISLLQEDLTRRIIGAFYEVYKRMGGGFAEAVYEESLAQELEDGGLVVERQSQIPVHYRGRPVGQFRADIVVNETVLIEIKAREDLHSAHRAQLLNYLRATSLEIGLLFNFGPKPQFKRLVFSNSRKRGRG